MTGGSVERERGWLRRLWWLWLVLLLAGLGGLGWAATQSALLDVERIEVEGAGGNVTEAEILAAAGIRLGQPLVELDLAAVDARLTAVPWIAEATVSRSWSGTVRLRILERSAVAVGVDPEGRRVLLDSVGAVLEEVPMAAPEPGFTRIRIDGFGPTGSRIQGIAPLLRAAEAVPSDLGAWIVALTPTGDGIRAELVGGAVAEFGESDDYRDQVRTLATVLTQVTLTCLREVDVSIPENPVVRRGAC